DRRAGRDRSEKIPARFFLPWLLLPRFSLYQLDLNLIRACDERGFQLTAKTLIRGLQHFYAVLLPTRQHFIQTIYAKREMVNHAASWRCEFLPTLPLLLVYAFAGKFFRKPDKVHIVHANRGHGKDLKAVHDAPLVPSRSAEARARQILSRTPARLQRD